MLVSQQEQRAGDPSPELIEACRQGDRIALDRVLREHLRGIERLICRMVGPGADLEDLVQQTMIAVIHAFPRFRGEASVRHWMAGIAVNIVRQHFRRPERRRRASLELVVDEVPDHAVAVDRHAGERQTLARVYHHLEKIAPKKRLAFTLHVIGGYPVDEVAALTGATKAATKSRIMWARRALLKSARRDPALADSVPAEEVA